MLRVYLSHFSDLQMLLMTIFMFTVRSTSVLTVTVTNAKLQLALHQVVAENDDMLLQKQLWLVLELFRKIDTIKKIFQMKTKSADGVHVVVKDAFISKVPETGVTLVSHPLTKPKSIRENNSTNFTLKFS